MPSRSPILPTDDDARALARALLTRAQSAALAVIEPATGAPFVTRIALGLAPDGAPVSLVSDLAAHTAALRANPACSLLVGDPGPKGDPLTHPRLTLQARAAFVARGTPGHAALRAHYLAGHPKAKLYADFADFHFLRFAVTAGHLNGGFGRAFRLTPEELLA
ncbi:pyridoxamine 5'-phosphate oxidase family protein [Actibacterium sp. MT2.3-13A]|uniref:HugZ family pyridoxamine 5'-phosphate oxidase n=1 Tax=Actibacterium sp. MT2.3-13A TaxID=2828332 RepID=UPI001BA8EE45|nr:pyridoxamine 5'-phosphate oxidase family protein [Actibacterium sp. MT2.3-13A]